MQKDPNIDNKQLTTELNDLRKKYDSEKKKRIEITNKLYELQQELSVYKTTTEKNKQNTTTFNNITLYNSILSNSIVNLTSEIILSLNREGNITFLNEQGHKLIGYKNEKLTGKNWFEKCIPIKERKAVKANFKKVLEQDEEKVTSSENTVLCKNGLQKKIQWYNTIIKDNTGKLIGSLSFGKDISEWKNAQEKIERQSKMQEVLIDLASRFINIPVNEVEDSINLSLANMGSFINADRAYIFDYDWQNDITINTFEWCADGISPEIDNLKEVPLSAIPQWASTHKKGNKMLIHDTSKLTEKDAGLKEILLAQGIKSILTIPLLSGKNCIGFVGFDSVKSKKIYTKKEEDLLHVFSNMLVNVSERKKVEENLNEALEKAQESDRLKSAFLANMSHEIRTPMSGILGFTNLLKKPELSGDKKKKYIDIIEKSGKRMLSTINDIIDISRIESGQVEIVNTDFCINEILEELFIFFKQEAEAKGINLQYKSTLSNTDALIISDAHKLEGILTNLIKNGIKFTEKGSVTFGYQLKEINQQQYLEFYVSDTGIGIPENRIDAIFNRFEQADIEDKMALEGSGLGLSISKSYLEMLGGSISVVSKINEGSTFTFSIPYIKQSPKAKNSTIKAKEQEAIFKNLLVIIAEDDSTNTLVFKAMLEDYFGKVLYASNGEETIELCKKHPNVDLILMDIKMPKTNGYDATRAIRKFNKKVVIIAQTAYGLTGDREKALQVGCNDYIGKPIIKDDILEIIKPYFI